MRIVPLSLTVRAFPIGRTTPVQPTVGGGIGFYRWQYARRGVHRLLRRHAAGVRRRLHRRRHGVGGLVLFGVRVPIGHFNVGGEALAGWQRRRRRN